MKKLACLPVLLAAVITGGCVKISSDSTVKNDGSATIKIVMSYKTEVFANIKAMIEAAGGDESNPQLQKAKEGIAKFESAFDDKKISEEWKKLGLEISKSVGSEKDGWKGFEIEGMTKNLAEYNRKHADAKKASSADSEGPMGGDPVRMALPRLPKFYKTDQPNIAKVVMVWRDPSEQDERLKDLENMSDEMREQVEGQLDMARAQFSIDDMKIEMRVKLPGKILSVSNAKQDGDVMVFQLLGSSLSADTISKMSQNPSATLQFDPKEFKIVLEDEPKAAESKPASRKAEKPKKDEEEKKKKDEDK